MGLYHEGKIINYYIRMIINTKTPLYISILNGDFDASPYRKHQFSSFI